MDNDPFQSWYACQAAVDEEKNVKIGEWKFFDLSWDVGADDDIQEKELDLEQVETWVENYAQSPPKTPGVSLLIARHKDIGKKDVRYWWLPFRNCYFMSILERLNLPAQYVHLRSTGGAHSGAQTYHTSQESDGKISRVSFVIRPAHTSIIKYSSAWSFALSWDARTGRTTGFLDGITASDMIDLKSLLRHCSYCLQHPLTLPEILLEMVTVHLNDRIRLPSEEEFFVEERRTGLSRVPSLGLNEHSAVWSWTFKDFQRTTAMANKYITTLAYLKTRFGFAIHLTRRFLTIQNELEDCEFTGGDEKRKIIRDCALQRKERLRNRLGLLENYEHHTECMQKRAANLITVLYTVLSQIDSRNQGRIAQINLQVARAVRGDSIPVRTIAYVTLVLLPGAFIAAIFGMNFFQFDTESRSLVVAGSFWQYWAITIPVTLFVVGLWNYWVYVEKKEDSRPDMSEGLLLAKNQLNTEELEVGVRGY